MSEVVISVKEYRELVEAKTKIDMVAKMLNSNVYLTGEEIRDFIGGMNGKSNGEAVKGDRKSNEH